MTYGNTLRWSNGTEGREMLLEELVRKYQRQVSYICFGYTKNWEDARELTQEAFLKAYQAMDRFEGRCHPMTWITRIAINQCLTFVASRGRERLRMLNYLVEQEEGEGDDGWRKAATRATVGRLLDCADPVTRKVLDQIMHQEVSHSHIASTLGVSRVAVTRRITRFRKKALDLLGRQA